MVAVSLELAAAETQGFVSGEERQNQYNGAGSSQSIYHTVKIYKKSLIFICVLAFVLLIILASVLTSPPSDKQSCFTAGAEQKQQREYRGDAKRVILISLDGFRHDYLDRPEIDAPNLRRLIAEGTRAERLQPVFPSKTFPSHYSIATGLYPASHGIVSNGFTFQGKEFNMSSTDTHWWLGEPIWQTAVLQGKRVGIIFWPGASVNRTGWHCKPPSCFNYNGSMPNEERVGIALELLAMPARPDLLMMYFSDTDDAGHQYGQDSPKIGEAVERIDKVIGELLAGLEGLGLLEETHVLIVGDHGMVSLCLNKRINIDDLFLRNEGGLLNGLSMDNITPGLELGSMLGVWTGPSDGTSGEARRLLAQRVAEGLNASAVGAGLGDALQVFTKGSLPPRLGGFGESARVWDVVGLVAAGYQVGTRALEQKCITARGISGCSCGGSHGYDNKYGAMGSVLIGRGPRFPTETLLPGWVSSLEVYSIISDILGIRPAPNNGTAGFAAKVLLPRR